MPSWKSLLDSRYLKQEDIGEGKLVTLRAIDRVNIAQEDQPEDMKPCAKFDELKKPMILNSTNLALMAAAAGSDDIDDWIGTKFVLYVDHNVAYMGKIVGGIRVRKPKKQAQAPPPLEVEPGFDDEDPIPF